MSLAAGDLNRRIRIERRGGADAAGQPSDDWMLVAEVWANVRGQTGLGTIATAQNGVAGTTTAYSFRIRYRTGLDAGMRVVYAGQNFEITQVRMDFNRREWTDLVCTLGISNG